MDEGGGQERGDKNRRNEVVAETEGKVQDEDGGGKEEEKKEKKGEI